MPKHHLINTTSYVALRAENRIGMRRWSRIVMFEGKRYAMQNYEGEYYTNG